MYSNSTSVARTYRENTTKLITFYSSNRHHMEAVFNEFVYESTKVNKKKF